MVKCKVISPFSLHGAKREIGDNIDVDKEFVGRNPDLVKPEKSISGKVRDKMIKKSKNK